MIQIDEVAADARPLIEAFRQAGGLSFEKLGVDAARSAYERSCAANGLPPVASVDSVDMTLGSDGVRVRWYSARATTASANRPVVLFLHGGGWVIGSLETHDSLCRYLAAQVLVDVVAVDYRLAPEWPYPAAIDDSRAAMAALARGDITGSPPPAIAVMGDSAGGALAATLAAEYENVPEPPRLAAQVLLYPVTDLTMATSSYGRITEGFALTAATMRWFAGMYAPPGILDSREPSASPAFARQPPAPAPAYICTVGLDPLSDEGRAYAEILCAAGGSVLHRHLPRHAHGLFTSAGRIQTARDVLGEVVHFLRRELLAPQATD